MARMFVYFKYSTTKNGVSRGELRVSVLDRLDRVIKDMTYKEFKLMKGYDQVRLQKMKYKTFTGV